MDSKLEKYLKERNIPTDSLEANSIREGVNWAIEQTIEFFNEELNRHKRWFWISIGINF